jgi:hypothetical protein
MVESLSYVYDHEDIPLVHASMVSIDAELYPEVEATFAHAIPSPSIGMASSSISSPTTSISSSAPQGPPPSQSSPQAQEERSDNDESFVAPQERERTVGAGAAGAVLGLLLGGPFFALVLGFGSAYYCKQQGVTGDTARALGDVALVARDKARQVNQKHHIVDRSKVAATDAIHRIQEADRNHEFKTKLQEYSKYCWKSTLEFAQRHRLVDRGSEKLKQLVDMLVEKMRERSDRVAVGAPAPSAPPSNEYNDASRWEDYGRY